MSLRDVTIARDEEEGDRVRMTSRIGSAEDFGDFEEKLGELKTRRRTRRFDFWGSLRRDEFARQG